MGFVDRGGGRESKGGSLRRSKKNPGASAARKASAARQPQHATRVPPTMPSFTDKEQHIDAAIAILARKLEVDRDVLMARASQESGVAAILTW
ncbi:hypothetical protein LSM04_002962 [Trypanosoma melophagium]|uniref:uncharacterized protein n=1 Tax=Trypanosoma melophagium TaxID=715481 RepID=UPI003519FD16|nr:hypothetical protein LSM04_002962 [Trypanosoma melophagium]